MAEKEDKSPLDAFTAKLEDAKKGLQATPGDNQQDAVGSGLSYAVRVSVEIVSGLLVGAVMGYFLDKWLGTKPLFFLICFLLGAGAGGVNVYRMATRGTDKTEDDT